MRLGQMLCPSECSALSYWSTWIYWPAGYCCLFGCSGLQSGRKVGGRNHLRGAWTCVTHHQRGLNGVFSQILRTPKQHVLVSSPPTPSALTFTFSLSWIRCEATLFLSLFLFWYEGLGLKRFHLSFSWVTLVYYYCQFPFRNVPDAPVTPVTTLLVVVLRFIFKCLNIKKTATVLIILWK